MTLKEATIICLFDVTTRAGAKFIQIYVNIFLVVDFKSNAQHTLTVKEI